MEAKGIMVSVADDTTRPCDACRQADGTLYILTVERGVKTNVYLHKACIIQLLELIKEVEGDASNYVIH